MEIDYAAIGARIQELRKGCGLLQEGLAKAVGVSGAHLSEIESGKTKFSLPLLMRLSEALKTTPAVILDMDVAKRDEARQKIMDGVDRMLADCTKAQLSMLQKVVHSTKIALEQYEEEQLQAAKKRRGSKKVQ